MQSEMALKKFSFKEDFLERFVKTCGANPECVFSKLRVTYDYTKHEEVDAVLLTSQKVVLLEIVTLAGTYKSNKENWVKEERVEQGVLKSHTVPIPNGSSSSSAVEEGVVSQVTIISTSVPNPVVEAKRKLRALKQHIESKIGPRNNSDFDYRVIIGNEQCTIETEESKTTSSKIVLYKDIEDYGKSLKIGWSWWILEKVVPMWPVWISGYTQLKNTLKELPTLDVLVLKSGSKLYGELRRCPGIPYDPETTSELTFKEGKTGYMFGTSIINVQGVCRGSGKHMFTSPHQLDPSSCLEFLCVDADSSTSVKVSDIVRVQISRRDT